MKRKGRADGSVKRKRRGPVTMKKRIAAALTAVVFFCGAVPTVTYATTTQEQINKAQEEKNELEGRLDDKKDQLDDLKGEHNSLKGNLNKLNSQLTQVSENLAALEQQIMDKEQDIDQTQAALEEAKETESWQQECMRIRIRAMYEHSDSVYLEALLGSGSITDMLNMKDYYEEVAAYDQMKLEEFKENRKLIEETEARLVMEKADLDNLKIQAEAEKNKVSGLISQTANKISDYAGQISSAEAEALAYEAEIKKKEEDLDYLRKKLAEEIAMSQAAANATWRDISEVTFAEGDRYLLANLIYCEAGGEPYAGQLAVGSVVVNRVLSSVYPDSIVGVIYQNRQFSPVGSGRLDLALASNSANANCYRAADEAMSGVTNVGNCVYFRTPVEGLNGISIGGHIFY